MMRRRLVLSLAALAVGAVSACAASGGPATSGGHRLQVAAAFYPLEYAVMRVGGDHVSVLGLTKPGGEPHDLELTPKQVASVANADLVVYEKAFQPAVDAAVANTPKGNMLDVSTAARLDLQGTEDEVSADHAGQGKTHTAVDPHFWLDPMRYADVADAIAERLAKKDPAHAIAYRDNAKALRTDLSGLDKDLRTGLATCRVKELVTSHAAFGYLARAYGLHQEGITGLDPEAEPNPAELAQVVRHVRESGAHTIYAETLVSRDVADTLARETGTKVAVLDPIEGITSASAGTDYLAVMRANLATLRKGQDCP